MGYGRHGGHAHSMRIGSPLRVAPGSNSPSLAVRLTHNLLQSTTETAQRLTIEVAALEG